MTRHLSPLVSQMAAAVLLVALSAAPAGSLPYTGTLELNFNDSIFVSVSGQGEGTSGPDSVSLTAGGVLGTGFSPVGLLSPSIFPIVNFEATGPAGLATASFVRDGPGLRPRIGGTAPLVGVARAGLFGTAFNAFAALSLPLSIIGMPGAQGVAADTRLGITVSAFGNGWTTGLARVLSTGGFPLVSSNGFDGRTSMGGGLISLVTPTLVMTNIAGFEQIGLATRLTLDFERGIPDPDPDPGGGPSAAVPEPGALWVFAAGWALVAGATRRRR